MEKEVLTARVEAVRAEGGHTSWGYHSRASLAHRYVAMTAPKVACTTIKMALQTWEGCGSVPERWADVHAEWAGPTLLAYTTAQIVEMLRSPDYLRFTFVRNPYGRLASAWKSKLAWDDPQCSSPTSSTIRSSAGLNASASNSTPSCAGSKRHRRWRESPGKSSTPRNRMPLAAVYDPKLARRVYDHYIADFETFGYHKDRSALPREG